MLADAKVSHPLLGYATARERARKGAGGFVGLIAEADGAFEFEVDSIIAYCQRRKKYLVRWLGYGEEDDWKKANEIDPELVKEFNRLRNSRSAVSSANKRRIAKASYINELCANLGAEAMAVYRMSEDALLDQLARSA